MIGRLLRRWWHHWFPPLKDVTAWKALAETPDTDPGLIYPDDWPVEALRGKSRRARVSRYPEADADKLRMKRATVTVLHVEWKERAK